MRLLSDWKRRPFACLVSHFASVIVSSGQESGGADLNISIGGLFALLAVPGAFFSMALFDKYSSLLNWFRGGPARDILLISIPDKYFFIVFAMVVSGAVATLKWDRIFPSRQDYANLAPLPIAAWKIYLANLTAILLLASLFVVDVNAASALLFPLVVVAGSGEPGGSFFAFAGAHAATLALASAFTFFACFALIGMLVSCLPQRVFRAVSLWVRLLILIALMTCLLTSFAAPKQLLTLRWLPPVWFLAFYQSLQDRASGDLALLASLAWKATASVFALSMLFGAISYRRYFLRIPESSDSRQTPKRKPLRIASGLLDGWFLRSKFQRACYHFSLRALLRSESHCILFGASTGLGFIGAVQLLAGARNAPGIHPDLLAAPLCVAFFLIAGLRFCFEVPAGLLPNWVFRLTVDRENREAAMVARKLILTFLVPVVILPCLIGSSMRWGVGIGFPHAAFVLAWSLLLMEAMLLRLRKIPFTCALPPFENHAIVLVLAYVVAYFAFTSLASHMELWMFLNPLHWIAAPLVFAVAWYGLRKARQEAGDPDARLIYDERPGPAVQTLDIAGTN